MKKEAEEKRYIDNGESKAVDDMPEAPAAGGSPSVYEVIRVVSGVPLFLEKHMERLEASVRLAGHSICNRDRISRDIIRLIGENGNPDKNIKLVVYNLYKESPDYIMSFIKSSYPSPVQYEEGVPAILLNARRDNPNAKIVNQRFKDRVEQELHRTGAYEALLVDENGFLTEGSRSNVFAVSGNKVYTAPKENVLIGVTRGCITGLCERNGIELVEKGIRTSFLNGCEGLFMTGTSPKVLPIASVDGRSYASCSCGLIRQIRQAYDKLTADYIQSWKRNPPVR